MASRTDRLVNRIIRLLDRIVKHHRDRHDYSFRDERITGLVKNRNILTKEQKQELQKLWGRLDKHYDNANHAFFVELNGDYNPQYIPNGFHYIAIDQYFNDWNMAMTLDNKCLYKKIFSVRTPVDICYRMNGFWFDADYSPISQEKAIELISAHEEAFMKVARDSYCGKGVFFLSREIIAAPGGIAGEIAQTGKSDLVVQETIRQSPVTAAFCPSSVNSMRVFTFMKKDGTPQVFTMFLRTGVGTAKVDNAFKGGLCCGINPETGQMSAVAYDTNGGKYTEHPTSHIRFSDITIPNIEAVKALVCKAHPCIPYFRLVGWDVALDENNEPLLMEANMAHPGLEMPQMCNGPMFGDLYDEVMDEVFGKH